MKVNKGAGRTFKEYLKVEKSSTVKFRRDAKPLVKHGFIYEIDLTSILP